MKLLSERLKFAIADKESRDDVKITNAELARVCGSTRSSLTNWLKDKNGIKGKQARLLGDFLGVDPVWLETGFGNIKAATKSNECAIDMYEDVAGAMGKGIMLRDQPGQITQMVVTNEWITKNVPSHTASQNLCIVTGFGDSMHGMFNSGDPLLVDSGIKSVEYDGVYFFRVGDEGFIKRLQRIPGDGIRVISKNPDYESWTITKDMDFEVFGRVLKVWQSEKF